MKHSIIAFFIMAVLLMPGCKNASHNGGSPLAATKWTVVAWSASSLSPAAYHMIVEFNDTQLSGRAAINSYSGSYSATANGVFSIGLLQATEMAGAEDAMRAEGIYFELLRQARQFTLDHSTLQLLDAQRNDLLVFERR